MKKMLLALSLLVGVAASAPATAQVIYVPAQPRVVCVNVPVAQYVTVWTVYGPVTQLVYGYQTQCYWTY